MKWIRESAGHFITKNRGFLFLENEKPVDDGRFYYLGILPIFLKVLLY
jgi:hypothetical protein